MSVVKPQFLIGAAASGSGKTTFTMGAAACAEKERNTGAAVQVRTGLYRR